jgi:putative SOS response-associated peptidase YedK
MIDGADPENKELRGKLFQVSSVRAKYPQLFLRDGEGEFAFVGLWEHVRELNDADESSGALTTLLEDAERK